MHGCDLFQVKVTLHTLFLVFCFDDFLVVDIDSINLHVIIYNVIFRMYFNPLDMSMVKETSKHFEIVNLRFAAVFLLMSRDNWVYPQQCTHGILGKQT